MSSEAPRDTAAFEVRDALREDGCVVCRLSLRSVARLLQSIAYEQVNDLSVRKDLRRARGFCNAHAYQWLREAGSVLGTALIYRDVLHAALRDLSPSEPRGRLLRDWLRPARHTRRPGCPLCKAQLESEQHYVGSLLAVVNAEPALLEGSSGVCHRHALAAARLGGSVVVDHTRRFVEAVLDDLDEVIRKEDYRFRHEARTDAERSAPARAIGWAAGREGLTE